MDDFQKITNLSRKQIAHVLPMFIKVKGIMSELYYPIKQESIYNRDSQEILYGANPDLTTRILFTKLPGMRDPVDNIIDTLDLEDRQEAYGLDANIPDDTLIKVFFNGSLWQWRVKDVDGFFGADDKLIYVHLNLVGIA